MSAAHATCTLLEDHVVVQYSWIIENTTLPETLEVTENRQYRERGLLHISDLAYQFVLQLEGIRVKLLNTHRIEQSSTKTMFVDDALKEVLAHEQLRASWDTIFQGADPDMKVPS